MGSWKGCLGGGSAGFSGRPLGRRAATEHATPALFVHARNGLAPYWGRAVRHAAPSPTTWHWLDGQSETAFYDDPALVRAAADLVAGHLVEGHG